jgi:hypothetical protein
VLLSAINSIGFKRNCGQDPSLDDSDREWIAIWKPLPKAVFSATLPAVQGNARLASGGLAEEIERLRAEPGEGDIAIGGATLAAEAAALGLIDEYRARVYPVLDDVTSPRPGGDLSDAADLVGVDGDQQSCLVAAAVPRVRPAQVALGQLLDMVCRAVFGHGQDPAPDGEVPVGFLRIGDGQGDPRVTFDVSDLLKSGDAVDQDVLTVGVNPGLGQLGRAVGHQGGHVAQAGQAQQGE